MFEIWNRYKNEQNKQITDMILRFIKHRDSSLEDQIFKVKNSYDKKNIRIQEVQNLFLDKLNIDKETFMSIFLPYSSIYKFNNEKLIDRFVYLKNYFETDSLLLLFIKNQSLYEQLPYVNKKNNLFAFKKNPDVDDVFLNISNYFNLSKHDTLQFCAENTYYFATDLNFIKAKMETYSKLLQIDADKMKQICLIYPSSFYSSIERLEYKLEHLMQEFELNKSELREMILKYPPILEYQITTIRLIKRILNKYSSDFYTIIYQYPYILNLVDVETKNFYGNFQTFDEVVKLILHILEKFESIVDVRVYKLNQNNIPICIVKSNYQYKVLLIDQHSKANMDSDSFNNLKYVQFDLPNYTEASVKRILQSITEKQLI